MGLLTLKNLLNFCSKGGVIFEKGGGNLRRGLEPGVVLSYS